MKLIIFGATGTLGRHVTQQALDVGHQVTAFTRGRTFPNLAHPNLTVVSGDVMNVDQVRAAIEGQDAVLCTLGAGRKGIVRSEGTRSIVAAMHQAGVDRLICQTSLGVHDSANHLNFFWKYVMFGLLLRPAFTDHHVQEDIIRASGLNWTIVRPSAFTDKPTGPFQTFFETAKGKLKLKITRADVAGFMLDQLGSTAFVRKTPGISA